MYRVLRRQKSQTALANHPDSTHVRPLVTVIPESPRPKIRWVRVGDSIFGVRPDERYDHLLADGTPYFPYYDDTLTTVHLHSYTEHSDDFHYDNDDELATFLDHPFGVVADGPM